jgi:hypothetical protein
MGQVNEEGNRFVDRSPHIGFPQGAEDGVGTGGHPAKQKNALGTFGGLFSARGFLSDHTRVMIGDGMDFVNTSGWVS